MKFELSKTTHSLYSTDFYNKIQVLKVKLDFSVLFECFILVLLFSWLGSFIILTLTHNKNDAHLENNVPITGSPGIDSELNKARQHDSHYSFHHCSNCGDNDQAAVFFFPFGLGLSA
jgi:hypothetical protein